MVTCDEFIFSFIPKEDYIPLGFGDQDDFFHQFILYASEYPILRGRERREKKNVVWLPVSMLLDDSTFLLSMMKDY